MRWLKVRYRRLLPPLLDRPRRVGLGLGAAFALTFVAALFLGEEFMPQFKEYDFLIAVAVPEVRGAETVRCGGLMLAGLVASPALAQAPSPAPPPAAIADNSFLLEEAYNQEHGVVQHISAFLRPFGQGWSYTFTQEWPVPAQKHQLSVTVPLQTLEGATGLGDVALNYRYQVSGGSPGAASFSPRLSLLLPTGSSSRGLGAGGAGLQVNLPVSVPFGRHFISHSNLGATWVPDEQNEAGHEADTSGWNAGQSAIWLARPDFNVMLELAWSREEAVVAPGSTVRRDSFYVNPGVRWAHNFKSGLQIVPGLAVPIGLGPSRGDEGLFLYLSFEHPFRRAGR